MHNKFFEHRSSGVLLHITSLPSAYGIGDIGPWAYHFVDFLKSTHQKFWQILPLNPTDGAYGNSPYSSVSAFAVNPLLISPEFLKKDGWINTEDLKDIPKFPAEVDYALVEKFKSGIFEKAYQTFVRTQQMKHEVHEFFAKNDFWLNDYALFVALKTHFENKMWCDWPEEVRDRHPQALNQLIEKLQIPIEKIKFQQFLFFNQWSRLKDYCKQQGIDIIGDIPIYVNYDSADVWSNPKLFKLNDEKRPISVAGVPPDYFSKDGQRWGNPIYLWDRLKETSFKWWMDRFDHNFKIFNLLRIDHFRGLIAFWEIPAAEKTAINGHWVDVPFEDFFKRLLTKFSDLPFIAEDLGLITPDVTVAMKKYGFPGMKILLFAFAGDPKDHPYIPENYEKNSVVYTGTHDNNTVRGWYENDISDEETIGLAKYMGKKFTADEISWALIKLAMMSVSQTAIIPMQDILNLGAEARMNTPSTSKDNWRWKLDSLNFSHSIRQSLTDITEISLRKF